MNAVHQQHFFRSGHLPSQARGRDDRHSRITSAGQPTELGPTLTAGGSSPRRRHDQMVVLETPQISAKSVNLTKASTSPPLRFDSVCTSALLVRERDA
jgi:hypothetical protein